MCFFIFPTNIHTSSTETIEYKWLSNEMQHKAVYLLFCKFILHVSGVNHTHGLRYCAATSLAWPRWREVAAQYWRL